MEEFLAKPLTTRMRCAMREKLEEKVPTNTCARESISSSVNITTFISYVCVRRQGTGGKTAWLIIVREQKAIGALGVLQFSPETFVMIIALDTNSSMTRLEHVNHSVQDGT